MSSSPRSVLGFDTCGVQGTVVLATLDQDSQALVRLKEIELPAKTSAARLVPALASLLQDAGLAPAALHALVVVHGPGSFTGVRVGVATAQGMAHATGVPLLAVSRLAVLASLSPAAECLALLDAGRGEYYAGHYRAGQCVREWLASHEEVAEAAASGLLPLTIAEASVQARVATLTPQLAGPLDAWAAVRASRERLLSSVWSDLATLDAHYVRRSDAELFARTPAPRT